MALDEVISSPFKTCFEVFRLASNLVSRLKGDCSLNSIELDLNKNFSRDRGWSKEDIATSGLNASTNSNIYARIDEKTKKTKETEKQLS